MILVIKTDERQVYVALFDGHKEVDSRSWEVHRELSVQLNSTIDELVDERSQIKGVVVYKGPGSFTGLRIGISVANALAYSLEIPVVGVSGDRWLSDGLKKVAESAGYEPVSPEYGGEVYTTKPVK